MAYKYFSAGSPPYFLNAGTTWTNDFQAFIDDQFYNAPDAFVIDEELVFESGSYVPVEVRINRGINTYTGKNLGDDFKYLIFKDLTHSTFIGMKYYFSNSYWIVVNTEIKKNFTASALVRRCNNVLRWMTPEGIYQEEPCAIDYIISRASDSIGTENPVTAMGNISIYMQMNTKTRKIKNNQRFLFGNTDNWIAFKVLGNGVRNYLNNDTFDNDSCRLGELITEINYDNNSNDNLVLGIADYYKVETSGSRENNIVFSPDQNYVLEGATTTYAVNYYSGSVIQSGSFVFAVSGSAVPVDHYTFTTIDGNSFSLKNIEKYLNSPLDISCIGISGSRLMSIDLKGAW